MFDEIPLQSNINISFFGETDYYNNRATQTGEKLMDYKRTWRSLTKEFQSLDSLERNTLHDPRYKVIGLHITKEIFLLFRFSGDHGHNKIETYITCAQLEY